jgi:hypothetical protein
VNEFAIAISALNPAFFGGDLQPNARMAQCAFAAVAGNSVCVDDADFGSVRCHVRPFECGSLVCAVMTNAWRAGKRGKSGWSALRRLVIDNHPNGVSDAVILLIDQNFVTY